MSVCQYGETNLVIIFPHLHYFMEVFILTQPTTILVICQIRSYDMFPVATLLFVLGKLQHV